MTLTGNGSVEKTRPMFGNVDRVNALLVLDCGESAYCSICSSDLVITRDPWLYFICIYSHVSGISRPLRVPSFPRPSLLIRLFTLTPGCACLHQFHAKFMQNIKM